MTNKLFLIFSLLFCFSLPVFADEHSSDDLIYFPPLEIAEKIETGELDYNSLKSDFISSQSSSILSSNFKDFDFDFPRNIVFSSDFFSISGLSSSGNSITLSIPWSMLSHFYISSDSSHYLFSDSYFVLPYVNSSGVSNLYLFTPFSRRLASVSSYRSSPNFSDDFSFRVTDTSIISFFSFVHFFYSPYFYFTLLFILMFGVFFLCIKR